MPAGGVETFGNPQCRLSGGGRSTRRRERGAGTTTIVTIVVYVDVDGSAGIDYATFGTTPRCVGLEPLCRLSELDFYSLVGPEPGVSGSGLGVGRSGGIAGAAVEGGPEQVPDGRREEGLHRRLVDGDGGGKQGRPRRRRKDVDEVAVLVVVGGLRGGVRGRECPLAAAGIVYVGGGSGVELGAALVLRKVKTRDMTFTTRD